MRVTFTELHKSHALLVPVYFMATLVLSLLPGMVGFTPQLIASGSAASQSVQRPIHYDAWMYPDAPGAMQAVTKHADIYAIKAEYLHIEDDGSITRINQSDAFPNGYSEENAAILRQHSREQYITISGAADGTALAMQNDDTIPQIVSFVKSIDFGVELDWEGFGSWTPQYYQQFKMFVAHLHAALQEQGLQLMIDGPPISDSASQSWYAWKYEELAPLVDHIVMMVYDNQYDTGSGNPIAPADWSLNCMQWLKEKTGNKGIAGIAAYGYSGAGWRIQVHTSNFIKRKLASLSPTRNTAGELVATDNDGTFYDYADTQTMQKRLNQVRQSGLVRLSVWSLGDNPWLD